MKNLLKTYGIVYIGIFQINTMLGQIAPIGPIGNAQIYEWAKSMGDVSIDGAKSVDVDTLGNVYTTGFFQGTVDFDPDPVGIHELVSEGSNDVFVSKLDASGNFVWAKKMGGTEADSGHGIRVDTAGNAYITGYFTDTADFDPDVVVVHNLISDGGEDIFISKLDTSGNFVWAKKMGGPLDDKGNSIILDDLGGVYTTGFFRDIADFDPDGVGTHNLTSTGNTDIFISKLDDAGNFVGAKRIGGMGYDVGNSIALDVSGNIFTTGYFEETVDFDPGAGIRNLDSAGDRDVFVSKLDNTGLFVGAKRMGGTGEDVGNGIATGLGGNVYTTGSFEGVADFNPNTVLAYTLFSQGGKDIFISKLDASGSFIWAKGIGGSGLDAAFSISIDLAGKVYTTGYFSQTVDFNPGPDTYDLSSNGSTDIFILKLGTLGHFTWAKKMGAGIADTGNAITVDENLNVYTVGWFDETVDFDPGTGIDDHVSEGFTDIFIQKLGTLAVPLPPSSSISSKVFPNPTSENLTLNLGQVSKSTTLSVKNFNGELISTETYKNKEKIDFEVAGKPGIYFVEIVDMGGKRETHKIIKE